MGLPAISTLLAGVSTSDTTMPFHSSAQVGRKLTGRRKTGASFLPLSVAMPKRLPQVDISCASRVIVVRRLRPDQGAAVWLSLEIA